MEGSLQLRWEEKQKVKFEYNIFGNEDVQNFADFLKNPGKNILGILTQVE